MKMIIYTAGKYSGDIKKNIEDAEKIAIEVWEKGHVAICPHLNTANFEEVTDKITYDDYISGDLLIISRCDAILMIPGWEESPGANTERDFAIKNKIPVYYYPDIPEV